MIDVYLHSDNHKLLPVSDGRVTGHFVLKHFPPKLHLPAESRDETLSAHRHVVSNIQGVTYALKLRQYNFNTCTNISARMHSCMQCIKHYLNHIEYLKIDNFNKIRQSPRFRLWSISRYLTLCSVIFQLYRDLYYVAICVTVSGSQ